VTEVLSGIFWDDWGTTRGVETGETDLVRREDGTDDVDDGGAGAGTFRLRSTRAGLTTSPETGARNSPTGDCVAGKSEVS